MTPTPVEHLGEIQPTALAANTRLIGEYEHPTFTGDMIRFFIVDQSLLVVQGETVFDDGRIWRNQLELPLAAASWIVDSIHNRFWRKPSEGGLPKNTLHDRTEIDGESIKINRGVSIGGEGIGGFSIANLSRLDYSRFSQKQSLGFTDYELKDMGLLDFLADLERKVQAGQI